MESALAYATCSCVWQLALWTEYMPSLHPFKRGTKNDQAAAKQSGAVPIKEGKEPLPFRLYVTFCEQLLLQPDMEAVFAHLFLIMSWNLMCRSKNTAEVSLSHMKVIDDALGVVFGKQKNDQGGEDQEYRHVYANPLQPVICPITALGLYFLCHPRGRRMIRLSSQVVVAGSTLWQANAEVHGPEPPFKDALGRCGLCGTRYGHTLTPQGWGTYCCCGTTDAPSLSLSTTAGGGRGGLSRTDTSSMRRRRIRRLAALLVASQLWMLTSQFCPHSSLGSMKSRFDEPSVPASPCTGTSVSSAGDVSGITGLPCEVSP